MRITELLKKESTELGVKVSDKEEAVDRLISLMDAGGRLKDTAGCKGGILAREALGSTAIGEGIVIPHTKAEAVKELRSVATVVPESVDYDASDGSLTNLLLVIAAPAEGVDIYLEALSRLSTLLMNPGSKGGLMGVADKDEFLRVIDEAETGRFGASGGKAAKDAEADVEADVSFGYRILAVTTCPTDIAHTHVAAENLENMGEGLGIALRAKTDGSDGARNALTRKEIAAADAIIIAVDKNVEIAKFNGKPVIVVPVTNGTHKAEELIKRTMDDTVPVYHHTGAARGESMSENNDSIGRAIYKHLMNGVPYMPLFAIGGDILIAPALLFDDCSINPASFGKNTSPAAYLKTMGEQAFEMILLVLAGFVAISIADRPDLAVSLVAELVAKMGSTFVDPADDDVSVGSLDTLSAGFVGGYIVVSLGKPFSGLLESLEGIKPVLLYPVIGIFLVVVVTTFVSPYMGMINGGSTHLLSGMGGTSRIVLGTVLGGMMSIDMDGPFNKAAYVFGTTQLVEGNFEIVAVIMAGGIIPPTTIALYTIFSKGKFTERGRQSSIVNYIMDLSSITEGTISSVVQGPLCVISSCIIDSTIVGGLSMTFGCILRTSHGGIFVLPTVGNYLMYLTAMAAGAATGCVILGTLKENAAQ